MYKCIYIGLALLLSACHTNKIYLDVDAAEQLNLSHGQQSLPVMLRVYQLSSDDTFQHAAFAQLYKHDKQILGESLLDVQQYLVLPGKNQRITIKQHQQAQSLGVIALFRQPSDSDWRLSHALPPSYMPLPGFFTIHLHDNHMRWEGNQ